MMATDTELVLIGNSPTSRQDMQPSSSHPPMYHDPRPSSRASNRYMTNHEVISDHVMKHDDPDLHSKREFLPGSFFPAQDTYRSDLDDLTEEPSPSRTGNWVERNASYEDELFTKISSQQDWSAARPWEEPENKSLRESGELAAQKSEEMGNTSRLGGDGGSSMKDLIVPSSVLTYETQRTTLGTELISSADMKYTFKEAGPISSAEPQHTITGAKVVKRDEQYTSSSKLQSVGKSQSGKYLFRPLTSARTVSRKDIDAPNIEKGIDRMIEKQMSTMFGKTFKKKIDNYVSGDDRFSGDVSGKTAVLTDRPPSGRVANQNGRKNSRGLECFEYEGMDNLIQNRPGHKEKKFNYVPPRDVSSRQDMDDMGRQQLLNGFEVDRAGSVTPSTSGLYGEQGGRATSSNSRRPNSARPVSAKQRSRYRHTPSFVDETLFGEPLDYEADFPSPFDKTPVNGRTRPIIFDCTDYRAKAQKENKDGSQRSRPQSRSGSVQRNSMKQRSNSVDLQSRPSSSLANEAVSRTKKTVRPSVGLNAKRHSYVDESLFGDPLEEAGWEAPWDKNKSRPRPLIFDATDYRRKDVKMMATGEKIIKGSSITRAGSERNLAVWR